MRDIYEAIGSTYVDMYLDLHDPVILPLVDDQTDRLSRNVVSFKTPDFTVTSRPSNTEPKLKFYVQAEPAQNIGSVRRRDFVRPW